jgi:hypothetical protein
MPVGCRAPAPRAPDLVPPNACFPRDVKPRKMGVLLFRRGFEGVVRRAAVAAESMSLNWAACRLAAQVGNGLLQRGRKRHRGRGRAGFK